MELAVPVVWIATSVAELIMSAWIIVRGKPIMFSLQPSGPQEDRISDKEERRSECTCSDYFSDF